MFAWGAVLVGMAFTNNWQVMAFLRFLLGAFEGWRAPWCDVRDRWLVCDMVLFVLLRCTHILVGTLERSFTNE
jgi:hypothetical protein